MIEKENKGDDFLINSIQSPKKNRKSCEGKKIERETRGMDAWPGRWQPLWWALEAATKTSCKKSGKTVGWAGGNMTGSGNHISSFKSIREKEEKQTRKNSNDCRICIKKN